MPHKATLTRFVFQLLCFHSASSQSYLLLLPLKLFPIQVYYCWILGITAHYDLAPHQISVSQSMALISYSPRRCHPTKASCAYFQTKRCCHPYALPQLHLFLLSIVHLSKATLGNQALFLYLCLSIILIDLSELQSFCQKTVQRYGLGPSLPLVSLSNLDFMQHLIKSIDLRIAAFKSIERHARC